MKKKLAFAGSWCHRPFKELLDNWTWNLRFKGIVELWENILSSHDIPVSNFLLSLWRTSSLDLKFRYLNFLPSVWSDYSLACIAIFLSTWFSFYTPYPLVFIFGFDNICPVHVTLTRTWTGATCLCKRRDEGTWCCHRPLELNIPRWGGVLPPPPRPASRWWRGVEEEAGHRYGGHLGSLKNCMQYAQWWWNVYYRSPVSFS